MLRLATVGHVTLDYISTSAWIKRALVPGGPAVHTSLAAASMGAEPHVVSKIGDDFGRKRTEWLEQTGVNTEFLKVTALPTTRFEIKYRKGRRALRLLNQCESLGFLDLREIRAHSLHIGPVAHEISEDVAKSFADQSRLTSLDPQGYLRRVGRENRVLKRSWFDKPLLRRIDVLKVSSDELRTMMENTNPRDALRKLAKIGPRICILTKGGQGCDLLIDEHVFRMPAYKAEKVVNPTGAGDTFIGVFHVEYAHSGDAVWSGCLGAAAASMKVERPTLGLIRDTEKLVERANVLLSKVRRVE